MENRPLTLKDLYAFYEKNFSTNTVFCAAENNGKPIVVQAEDIGNFESSTLAEGLMFLKLKVCHTNVNRNGSRITEENMTKAMPTLKYRPVLAYIKETSNGELDFDSHNMTINKDGSVDYEESQVGSFTADEPFLEYDEEQDKTYVIAYAAIPVDYTKTAEILSRKGGTKVSCELCINQMSYDAKEKVLDLTDFYFNGCTLLGEDIGEGMLGSRADIISLEDFSAENNSVVYSDMANVVKMLEEINNKISNLNIKNSEKEEGGSTSVKLEELLTKYEKTVEDLDFDYENMSDEELETKFEELFGGSIIEDPAQENFDNTKKCSIQVNGKEYTFEISLDDKLRALESLVNDSYSEQDNAYYCVKAYDSYVVMIDYWSGRAFKQSYKSEENIFTLTGDRVEVYCTYLTKEEEAAIDEMRSNYDVISNQLKDYQEKEAVAAKETIFESEDYNCIRESKDFTTLVEKSADYSVDEIQKECDALLLAYVKANNKAFAVESKPQKRVNIGAKKEDEYKPYGTLF